MPLNINTFRSEVLEEFHHILSFWQKHAVDELNGGFVGAANEKGQANPTADKGLVLNSRILWTFARAYLHQKDKAYVQVCKNAFNYLKTYFWDNKNGGLYWTVSPTGHPRETRKLMYGHSFAVYGFSEYYKATGQKEALEMALKTFDNIVKYSYDAKNGGYIEALGQEWQQIDDYILCRGDSRKSMNTHLHLLECFANLYSVYKNEKVRFHLKHCLQIMYDKILGPGSNSMTLFFTESWVPRSTAISYGHDIEASWLLLEAAQILGDKPLLIKIKAKSLAMATAAMQGLLPNNGLIYEKEPDNSHENSNISWWVMAEAMVGFYNAYQLSGKQHFKQKSEDSWAFIKAYLIDHENGEWHGGVDKTGQVNTNEKISMWKCPYHNARACLEMYHRLSTS